MKLQEIKNIDIAGKKVFIRCDFNVPMDEYNNILYNCRILKNKDSMYAG